MGSNLGQCIWSPAPFTPRLALWTQPWSEQLWNCSLTQTSKSTLDGKPWSTEPKDVIVSFQVLFVGDLSQQWEAETTKSLKSVGLQRKLPVVLARGATWETVSSFINSRPETAGKSNPPFLSHESLWPSSGPLHRCLRDSQVHGLYVEVPDSSKQSCSINIGDKQHSSLCCLLHWKSFSHC